MLALGSLSPLGVWGWLNTAALVSAYVHMAGYHPYGAGCRAGRPAAGR